MPCPGGLPRPGVDMSSHVFFARRRYAVFLRRARPGVITPFDGVDAEQKIWPDLRCESKARQGGEEPGALRLQSKFLPACHGVHTGNAEEKLPGITCFSRKAMANRMMDLPSMLLPHGREILPEHPDIVLRLSVLPEKKTLLRAISQYAMPVPVRTLGRREKRAAPGYAHVPRPYRIFSLTISRKGPLISPSGAYAAGAGRRVLRCSRSPEQTGSGPHGASFPHGLPGCDPLFMKA